MKFEVYQQVGGLQAGQWRWRLKAANAAPGVLSFFHLVADGHTESVQALFDPHLISSYLNG